MRSLRSTDFRSVRKVSISFEFVEKYSLPRSFDAGLTILRILEREGPGWYVFFFLIVSLSLCLFVLDSGVDG